VSGNSLNSVSAQIPPEAAEPPRDLRYARRVLLTVTIVSLMINYVETMVIPGIPTIQKDFNITSTVASWITSALLIVGSITAPLFGKLGDSYGKKRMFLIALGFYTVGVGIAGFSPSIYFLLASRAIQGVGFAIVPLALAIITDTFPKEQIAPAQGIISGTFAIGASIGLILGSYVVQDLGWPYAFHTALILSIVLIAASAKVLKKDTQRTKTRIDYTGAAILMAGIALTLVYITEGPDLGWFSANSLAFLVPGLALTIFFFIYENRRANPLIHLGLLRIRNVLVANIIGIISGISMFILFFAVVYYAQQPQPFGLNLTIIETGLTLGPATLVMLILGPLIGRTVTRIGPKPVLFIGATILIIGLGLFIFNRSTTEMVTFDVAVALVGAVSLIIPIVNMVSVSVPKESVAVGLGVNTMLRNIGGAIGPVLATSIMTTYTSPLIITIQGHTVVGPQLANSTAFNTIFIIGIALTILVMAISLGTKNYIFRKQTPK
jgi:EmrB/QacA subfamily drug resistance transporter